MEMREKTVKALEKAIQCFERYSGDEYGREYNYARVEVEVLEDTVALLKAQEPVEPVFSPEIEMDMSHWDCGACGGFLLGNAYPNAIKYIRPQYCSHCGRAVKWK